MNSIYVIPNICRICLCSKPLKNVSELKCTKDSGSESSEDIMLFCLNIQIEQDSNVNTKLCSDCFTKIIDFHEFKSLALNSEAYLRSLGSEKIKNEDFTCNVIKEEFEETFESIGNDIDYSPSDNEVYDEIPIQLKAECKQEGQLSQDESLDIENITYEYVTKENAQVSKKKKCQPHAKTKKNRTKCKKENKIVVQLEVCPECGKQVKNLKMHSVIHCPQDKRETFKCDYCEKVFQTKTGKKLHVRRRHYGAAKQQCSLCNIEVMHLKQHIKTVHEPESRKFQCVFCSKKYMTQSVLNTHLTLHTDAKPYQCDVCGQSFRTNQLMTYHTRRIHQKEKSYTCDLCSKSFFKKERLVVHLRTHTREKPYKCPDCEKAFVSSDTLKNHRFSHTEKKIPCTLCKMKFNSPRYLRAHMLSHTRVKRYPCHHCPVAFHRSDHRKRHEFTAHLKHGDSVDSTHRRGVKAKKIPEVTMPQW